MIIKNLITHVISAPLEQPFYFSQGYVYRRSSVIVEVIGEDGTSGFGECMCHGQQSPFLASSFVENCYKEEVIGKDSLDVEVIKQDLLDNRELQ